MAALGYSNGLLSFYDLRLPSLFKLCEHPFGQSIDRLYSSPSSKYLFLFLSLFPSSNMCDYLWCLTGENNADCWNIEENKLVKRLAVDSTRQSQDPADMLVHHDLPVCSSSTLRSPSISSPPVLQSTLCSLSDPLTASPPCSLTRIVVCSFSASSFQ